MKGTLIVPTLNEADSIGVVIRSFRTAVERANKEQFSGSPIDWEVLVVDGMSGDGTADRAREAGARVLSEPRKGYGRAYLTGLAEAQGDVIATADGDGTYPVEEIPGLVLRLQTEQLDFISGDRLTMLNRKAMTTEHRIGNRLLNFFLGIAYHRFLATLPRGTLVDSQSGFWVFRRSILARLTLTQEGMAFSEEIKLEAVMRGFRFEEIPIGYSERWGAPKLSSWRDGQKNLLFLLEKRLAVHRESRHKSAIAQKKSTPY
jgi:glycosyltransferase involved in cell wall biosynthesis